MSSSEHDRVSARVADGAPSMKVHRIVAPVRRQVADQIRAAIIESHFKPGQRLTERELTDLTGVSRPTIREALQQLTAEGLIATTPGKGWVVAELTPEEAADLYSVRALIEGLAARLFVERADDAHFERLEAAFAGVEAEFTGDTTLRAMLAAKSRFYDVLFEGARSATIVSIIEGLHARVSVLRAKSLSYPGRPPYSIEELRQILTAVLARNPAEAALAAAYHVEQAATWALGDLSKRAQRDGKP